MIPAGGIGRDEAQSAAMNGISVMARKCPKIEEPAMSIRVMMAVFREPLIDFLIISKLTSRRSRAMRNTATVPIVPASVGLKNPNIIPPMTMPKTIRTTSTSGSTTKRSFQPDLPLLGAMPGLIVTQTAITRMNRAAIIRAGTIPARKSLPIDCSQMSP